MAARNAIRYLQVETTCAVCLDFFQTPVTILSCGHNFCRRCLWRCAAGAPCPQSRVPFPHGGLPPSRQLANVVAAVQELAPPPAQELCHTHQRPLTSVTAMESSSAPPPSSIAPTSPCRSKRPLAGTGSINPFSLQKQFEASLKTFQEEDERCAGLTEAAKETRQEMLTRVNAEKQKLRVMLKGLRRVLSDQESPFLSWLHLLCWRLEEQQRGEAAEMTWIRQCRAELQAKCQQPDGDLLRDAQTTLRRYWSQKASPRTPVLAPNPPFLGSSSHPAFFFLFGIFAVELEGVDG